MSEHARSRPRELEDKFNLYLVHPLSWRLARLLAPTGVSPNAVSIAGMFCVIAAGVAFASLSWPAGAVVGSLTLVLWHVVDGADGDLARITGRASPFGEMVDGACDYLGQSLLYVVLAWMLMPAMGLMAWPFTLAVALSHVVQIVHGETQRRAWLWRVHGQEWIGSPRDDAKGSSLSFGARAYLGLANRLVPQAAALDSIVEASRDDPARATRIGAIIREGSRGSLRFQKLLGSNIRTLLLSISMLAFATPLWFLIVEVTLLHLVLAMSILHHRRRASAMIEAAAKAG